jgi:hypothetical protein
MSYLDAAPIGCLEPKSIYVRMCGDVLSQKDICQNLWWYRWKSWKDDHKTLCYCKSVDLTITWLTLRMAACHWYRRKMFCSHHTAAHASNVWRAAEAACPMFGSNMRHLLLQIPKHSIYWFACPAVLAVSSGCTQRKQTAIQYLCRPRAAKTRGWTPWSIALTSSYSCGGPTKMGLHILHTPACFTQQVYRCIQCIPSCSSHQIFIKHAPIVARVAL